MQHEVFVLSAAQSATAVHTCRCSTVPVLPVWHEAEMFETQCPQKEVSVVIVQCGNAAPSGLFARTAVAQHSFPPSVDPLQSVGPVH